MLPSGSRQQKTYDRLQLPNERVEKRKPVMSALDLELIRLRSGDTGQTQRLKYKFDFTRQPGARSGRLSAAPGIIGTPSVPKRGTGQGTAPAGAPGHRKNAKKAQQGSHAGMPPAAKGHASGASPSPHADGRAGAGRPASSSVTDFRTVGPKPRGVKAPNLKDSMGVLGIGRGAPSDGRKGTTPGNPQSRPHTAAQGISQSGSKQSVKAAGTNQSETPLHKGWLSGLRNRKPAQIHAGSTDRAPVRLPDPKTVKKWAALRGMGEDEATVIGFDISRSVFSGVPSMPQEEEDPKAASTKKRAGTQKLKVTLSTIIVLLLIFVLLMTSIASGARVSEVTRQNADLDRSNDALAEQISKAQMQIALEDDLNKVRERAEDLGLTLPKEDQIEYVDLGGDSSRSFSAANSGGDVAEGGQ